MNGAGIGQAELEQRIKAFAKKFAEKNTEAMKAQGPPQLLGLRHGRARW